MIVAGGKVEYNLIQFIRLIGLQRFDLLVWKFAVVACQQLTQRVRGALDDRTWVWYDLRYLEYFAVGWRKNLVGSVVERARFYSSGEESAEGLKRLDRVDNLFKLDFIVFGVSHKEFLPEKFGDMQLGNFFSSLTHLECQFFLHYQVSYGLGHGEIHESDDKPERCPYRLGNTLSDLANLNNHCRTWDLGSVAADGRPEADDIVDNTHSQHLIIIFLNCHQSLWIRWYYVFVNIPYFKLQGFN